MRIIELIASEDEVESSSERMGCKSIEFIASEDEVRMRVQ